MASTAVLAIRPPALTGALGRPFPVARRWSGIGLTAGNVAVLAARGIVALALAAREFRWEPRAVGA